MTPKAKTRKWGLRKLLKAAVIGVAGIDEITACIGAMKSEFSGRGYRTPKIAFVTVASAPTIFAYGGKDNLVKPYHRDVLSEALKKNGVEHIGIDFPNSHHGMWDDQEQVEEFRKAVLSYCERYMK